MLGEVLDEVQRVADLVRDPGGQLAPGLPASRGRPICPGRGPGPRAPFSSSSFLPCNSWARSSTRFSRCTSRAWRRNTSSAAAMSATSSRAADLDPRLQVAARHAAHPVGQHAQPALQHPSHEQPGDQQGADQADRADSATTACARSGSPAWTRASLGGCPRARCRPARPPRRPAPPPDRGCRPAGPVAARRAAAPGAQVEAAAVIEPQRQQPGEDRHHLDAQRRLIQRRQAALDAAGRGLEPFP